MKRFYLSVAGAVALVSANEVAHANQPTTFGFGARANGLAGAVSADTNDWSAAYYNPAGLVAAEGIEVAFGYTYNWNHLRINGQDTGVDNVHGLWVGLVAPGEIADVPFAFGLATHIPDDGLSRITALRQEVPRWELYDHRPATLFLAAHIAVRPVDWLELGGGVAFLAATRGRFAVRGQADILDPTSSQLEHEVDADLTSVRYPIAGLRLLAGSFGRLGVTFRGENQLELGIDARLDGDVTFAGLDVPVVYELASRTIDGFVPAQLVIGTSLTQFQPLTVNADLTWVNWAAYESPTARTTASLSADVPAGLPVSLPDDVEPVDVLSPRFENRLVPRVGVEYVAALVGASMPKREGADGTEPDVLLELPLRVGYAFEATPVPPQTGATNFVDADRHTLAGGFGLAIEPGIAELPTRLALDYAANLYLLPEQTIDKDSPADFVGDYTADGTQVGMSWTLKAVF